ncbi:MAG: OmpA family protein, partial [Isosphaeraceae bacterium]|nr:OmpA family protein [Isosphaeraceae bacterium]
ALANALLVLAVLGLAGWGGVQIARRHWNWQPTFRARAEVPAIAGLGVGDRVRVQGIDAGVVEAVVPPSRPGRPVTLILRIDERLRGLVRSDATARIVSQGVVGARVVEIVPGRADAPPLAEGGTLRAEAPRELADLIRDATVTLRRVDAAAQAAEQGLAELNAIAASIRKGEGTLGRLVQDDEAYRKLISLSDQGEHTLADLQENLAALKRTWPISRYFNRRGFDDRDRILFQPGARREGRTLSESDLFEPGRAILTASGRRKLDEFATWFKSQRRPKATEVVIAAFTQDDRGDDVAQVLTQEQAEAVRRYLVSKHALDSVGLFGTRKVAAVGFGNETPRFQDAPDADPPPRRVEIILFTPQT